MDYHAIIRINEFAEPILFPNGIAYTSWPSGPKAVVRGASNCTLSNFFIDGTFLKDKKSNVGSDWPGLHVVTGDDPGPSIESFMLLHCDIGKWHDEVCLEAKQGFTIGVTVNSCTLFDAWPLSDMQGHAALWMIGVGGRTVNLQSTTFRGSHDGLEWAGLEGAAAGTLTITGCRFEDNENGLELVWPSGDLTLDVTATLFLRNHSKGLPFGTPFSVSGGAILLRDTPKITSATIRNCEFRTNGVDIQWDPDLTIPAVILNLGTASSLGQNNFCKDFSPFDDVPAPEPPDPYQVCLSLKSMATVDAVGNFWLPGNQGATAAGHLLPPTGSVTATTLAEGNLFTVDPFTGAPLDPPKPPGPMWGEFQPPPAPSMTPFLRNYSIVVGGTINLGTVPPNGTKPDCAVSP